MKCIFLAGAIAGLFSVSVGAVCSVRQHAETPDVGTMQGTTPDAMPEATSDVTSPACPSHFPPVRLRRLGRVGTGNG